MKKVIFSLIALMTAMVMNGQVKQTYLTLNNGVQMAQWKSIGDIFFVSYYFVSLHYEHTRTISPSSSSQRNTRQFRYRQDRNR